MCGIVGYIGSKNASPILMEGLERLSYRGYDSAGVAVIGPDGKIGVRKAKGRLENLAGLLKESPVSGTIGIGHTRWATHGEPSDLNAHPHTDVKGGIAVVHNGIIENHAALRRHLEQTGAKFVSQTDTEVIAHLLNWLYDGDMKRTLDSGYGNAGGQLCAGRSLRPRTGQPVLRPERQSAGRGRAGRRGLHRIGYSRSAEPHPGRHFPSG